MSAAGTPIFVDDTGRRRALTRRAGRIIVIGFSAYLGLVVLGFARDPRVGPISLPSFGLPSLGLITPPALPVFEAQESGPPGEDEAGRGEQKARSGNRTTPTFAGPTLPPTSTSTTAGAAPATAAPPTTTTTAGPSSAKPGNDPKGSTTTTATAPPADPGTTTTSTAAAPTTTTSQPGPGQGQGQGQDTAATSGKGPDGGGPPGQLRKATTPTTVG